MSENIQFVDEVIEQKECDTEIFKCKNCGATMVYDPAERKLKCDHCGTVTDIETYMSNEIPFSETIFQDADTWGNDVVTYRCNSCGAVSVMNKFETATACPFCGVTNIVEEKDLPTIKPNAILPFSIDKAQISPLFKKWLKKRIFASSKVKKTIKNPSNVNGVYLPCWTYDANTIAQYDGVLGKTVTRTVGSGKNRRVVTKTEWFHVNGNMARQYDDYIIEASHSINQKEINGLSPFPTKDSVQYDPKFVAGFSAERYDKNVDTGFQEMKGYVYKEYQSAIMQRHNATQVRYLNIDINYYNVTYKYLMLPLWLCSFIYKQKKYRVMVNGSTGKVKGKTPLSPIRVGIAAILGLGLIGLIIYLAYIAGAFDNFASIVRAFIG